MPRRPRFAVVAALAAAVAVTGCSSHGIRKFPDRPVAWDEHDDSHVPKAPRASNWQRNRQYHLLLDDVARAIDKKLALETTRPAEDVNALDEVPCSTWFCPRNHLRPLTPAALVAGPPTAKAPVPPFTIEKGKEGGRSVGYVAKDAAGNRFLLKFDPVGHLGLVSGPEWMGPRLFWAAGYNSPGAFVVDLPPEAFEVAPDASYPARSSGKTLPLTIDIVRGHLANSVARTPDGKVRVIAVPFIEGEVLGAFDYYGRRKDDPNDRIRHEHRRSLRATWVLYAWLNVGDANAAQTVDSYVEEDGRRFVRHYFVDFGAALGAWSRAPKGPHQAKERKLAPARVARSLIGLGSRPRSWQEDRERWAETVREHPSVGWVEGEGWEPEDFHTKRRVPAHLRMTDRDAYWGAKIVTSFTDAQIDALVDGAGYEPEAAAIVKRILTARRDAIGRTYLRKMTAVERPEVTATGRAVCWDDLALERGVAGVADVVYEWRVRDGDGDRIAGGQQRARSARSCVPIATTADYQIVTVAARVGGRRAKPAHIHLRYRPSERRLVVVGLERDE